MFPLGNYTSQWFGNMYLNDLDTHVKHVLKCKDYLRYCDDFCLSSDSKEFLNRAAKSIEVFLSRSSETFVLKMSAIPGDARR